MNRTVPSAKLGVIITGCSTGFGNSLARSLANQNITVYAGVRKLEDADNLKSVHANIVPILADVTNPEVRM
jgi:NADP-dependent 3-hydroxy acid dehydrogenase YdfG